MHRFRKAVRTAPFYVQIIPIEVHVILILTFVFFYFPFRYSEEVFSQHSRRHSNDTNSDLSDDEIFLPDETKLSGSACIRRTSKTGEILASPTHRKLTPTHIKSTGSSPIKRINKHSRYQFRSFDDEKIDHVHADDIHEHYRKVIAELKQTHEDSVKHMQYKLQSFEGPPADDEYLVSNNIGLWW